MSTSCKCISIYDVSSGKLLRQVQTEHSRPISSVVVNEPTRYVSFSFFHQACETFGDPFLTCAPDDTIRMWDLRSTACVRTFKGHKNTMHAVIKPSFSPCMRYVATGSEDRCCYLFDIRMGQVLHKLAAGNTDTVSSIQFHPHLSQAAIGSLDGTVRYFSGATS